MKILEIKVLQLVENGNVLRGVRTYKVEKWKMLIERERENESLKLCHVTRKCFYFIIYINIYMDIAPMTVYITS